MLLPDTTMQVSFLKDLVTQRNASSSYGCLNYLADRGRLADFINRGDFFPLRAEFHDYLSWAAARVRVPVDYATEIDTVTWRAGVFELHTPDRGVIRARNLVLGGGLRPKLPAGVTPGRRVFHNHEMLPRFHALPAASRRCYVVVGAGQSAAEVVAYLHDHTDAEVHAVFAKYGYTPADYSPYANRIFDADTVDEYYAADPGWRDRLMHYHRGTNYSAVDPALIDDLYRREYGERVDGRRRLFVHGASEVVELREHDADVEVTVAHRLPDTKSHLRAAAVIFATGFEPTPVADMLGDLANATRADRHGRPALDRLYRLQTADEITGQIFVQGNSEHTHGLTSTLLSNIAIRSGEITEDIARHRDDPQRGTPADLIDAGLSNGGHQ